MQRLSDLYLEIADPMHPERWYYYCDNVRRKKDMLAIKRCWKNRRNAYNFIKKYFKAAGKEELIFFEDLNNGNIQRIIEGRTRHIISVFLLGIKIAEAFGFLDDRNRGGFSFLYYWFLACLYHDVGYIYEKISDTDIIEQVANQGSNALSGIYEIRIDPLNTEDEYAIFQIYSDRRIVESYLKNRAIPGDEHEGKIDHGIAGGRLLYDRLKKSRDIHLAMANGGQGGDEYNFDTEDTLNLNVAITDYQAYGKAAEAVIVHNIRPDKLEIYLRRDGYDGETVSQNIGSKISCAKKLAFTLAIADTIEPMKRRKNFRSLDKIMIGQLNEEGRRGIEVKIDSSYRKIIESIMELTNWVDIEVDPPVVCQNYKLFRIYSSNRR